MIAAALLNLAQTPLDAERKPTRWVVKDVIEAAPSTGGHELYWGAMNPLGDPDRDGIYSCFFLGDESPALSGMAHRTIMERWLCDGNRELSVLYSSPAYSRFSFAQGYLAPYLTLLDAPGGTRAIIVDINQSPVFTVRDWRTGRIEGFIDPPPPPNPNWPNIFFNAFRRAGDVTRDGYDDIIFEDENGAAVIGLVDGRTLQTLWQHWEFPWASYAPVSFVSQGGPYDVTGDGILDVLHGTVIVDLNNPGSYIQILVALSGVDGAVIWRHETGWNGEGSANWSADINADAVPDVILFSTDDWRALDGVTGMTIWSIPKPQIGLHLDPGFIAFSAGIVGSSVQPARLSDGPRIYVPVRVIYPAWNQEELNPLLEIAANTGVIIGQSGLPQDIRPWASDLLNAQSRRSAPFTGEIGDVDRDGCYEIARRLYAPAWDLPATPELPLQYALMGPETLTMPEQATATESVRGRLWIPSGWGLEYRLLASIAFDGRGGERVDGWKTHLGPSQLLTSTLIAPAATGILDAEGKASFIVDLAVWPLPTGVTVTWKAVILKSGSAASVHTLSTLAQTRILP